MATQVGQVVVAVQYSQNQQQFNQILSSVRSINTTSQKLTTSMNSGFKSVTTQMRATNSALSGLMTGFKAFMGIQIFSKLRQESAHMLTFASDITETQHVVDTVYGELAESVTNFNNKVAAGFGVSSTASAQFTGTLGAMFQTAGIAREEAALMSATMSALAGDIGSFFNMSPDKAMEKLRSGLAGSVIPLRQLGINMTIANLESFALANGINKSWQAMSQQEQMILRYAYVLKSTGYLMGDFAKNQGSWANQTRLLTQNFHSLLAIIGKGFMVALLPVVKLLNVLLIKLQTVGNAFVSLMERITGKTFAEVNAMGGAILPAESFEGMVDGFGDVQDASKKTADKIKKDQKSLLGFDSILQLNEPASDSSSGLGGANGGASFGLSDFGIDQSYIDEVMAAVEKLNEVDTSIDVTLIFDKARSLLNEFLASIGVEPIDLSFDLKFIGQSVWDTIKSIIDTVSNIGVFMIDISVRFWNDLDGVGIIENIVTLINKVAKAVNKAVKAVTPALTTFYEVGIAPIVSWVGTLAKDALSFLGEQIDKVGNWFEANREIINEFGQTLGEIVKIVWGIIEPIADTAWSVFKTTVGLIVDGLLGLATWLMENHKWILLIVAAVGEMWLIVQIPTIIAGIVSAVTTVIGVIKGAIAVVSTIFGIIAANPLMLIPLAIAAIVTAVIYLWNTNEGFRDFIMKAWELIKQTFFTVVEAIKKFIGNLVQGFKDFISYMGDTFKPAIDVVVGLVHDIFAHFVERIIKIKDGIVGIFTNVIDFFKNIFTGNIDGAIENVKVIFTGLTSYLSGVFGPAFDVAMAVVSGIVTAVKDHISSVFDSVKTVFNGIVDFIKNVFSGNWKGAFESLKTIVSGVFDGIGTIVMAPFKGIITIWNSIVDKIGNLTIPDWVPGGLGGKSWSLPRISMPKVALANGGVVTGETWATIGEAGAEAVVPLENSHFLDTFAKNIAREIRGASTSTGSSLTVNIDKAFGDDRSMRGLAKALMRELELSGYRVGGAY